MPEDNQQSTPDSFGRGKVIHPPLSAESSEPGANTLPPSPAPVATPPPASSIYPESPALNGAATTSPTDTYIGLTGSQLKPSKAPRLIGVYIIAGFNLIGFVAGFLDTSQNSAIYTIAMFIDLLLAVGLLLRLDMARKLVIWLSALILIVSAFSLIMLASLQAKISEAKTNYEAAISRIDQKRLTIAQRQQLDSLKSEVTLKEKQAGKAINYSYIKLGLTAAETVAVMVYLSRPKVKKVFHD